jgi:hypothetical protein
MIIVRNPDLLLNPDLELNNNILIPGTIWLTRKSFQAFCHLRMKKMSIEQIFSFEEVLPHLN